ncbi:MAG: flavodoxin [Oscillospiraceae bacterium]
MGGIFIKYRKIITAVLVGVTAFSEVGISAVNADKMHTVTDVKNLQDFLHRRETADLSGADYDLNDDGIWNVCDLALMKREILNSQNTEDTGKTLVVYYSASGTTEKIADYITAEMNADTFVITPVDAYTDEDLDWTNQNSRVVMEHNDESRHTELVSVDVPDWNSYENVFIGYPIWWQEASWVADDFVKKMILLERM